MSVGIKIYNNQQQVMINSQDICFGFSQKITAKSNTQMYWQNKYKGNFTASNCVNPLIVYELTDVNSRPYIESVVSKNDGFELNFFTLQPNININFYLFDMAEVAKMTGLSMLRIYNQDGRLSFDNRILHLNIIGEVANNMILDPNKKYGVLIRSKSPYYEIHREWNSGNRFYTHDNNAYQMIWIENNILKVEVVTAYEKERWYYNTRIGSHVNNGNVYNIELARPLLVDLTLIKSLE